MGKCIICQKEIFKKSHIRPVSVYDKRSYDLIKCENCKTLFTYPVPSQDEIDQIYKEQYFYGAHKITVGEKRYRAKKMASYVSRFSSIKTALDVGSMYGFLIDELNRRNIRCAGIDIDPEAVAYCKKNNIPVESISLEGYLEKPGGSHDLIILSHVLEHLFDPKEKLIAIREKLNDGGKLLIAVPNIEAWTRKIFGNYWGYWDVPIHLTHFNKSTLRNLLESSGFEIVDVRTVGGSSLLFFSTLAKMLGKSGGSFEITHAKKWLIGSISSILKYWYNLGDDEILVVAKIKSKK